MSQVDVRRTSTSRRLNIFDSNGLEQVMILSTLTLLHWLPKIGFLTSDPPPIHGQKPNTTRKINQDPPSPHIELIAIGLSLPPHNVPMSDSESDDDLRPYQLGRREIGYHFFSDSDNDEEVRDYTSDDCFSFASFGSHPPNDMDDDDESDEDTSPPDGHICEDLAPNQGCNGGGSGSPTC